jgi:LAO/AO transport system kinase
MRRRLEQRMAEDPGVAALLDDVVSRRTDPASAAAELLARARDGDGDG